MHEEEIYQEHIESIVIDAWKTVLSLDIELLGSRVEHIPQAVFIGSILITGAWNGTVMLQVDEEHATNIASIIFQKEREELVYEEIADAIGEMTNILGGNIKALFPHPCSLGLPLVVKGSEARFLEKEKLIVFSTSFSMQGSLIYVKVIICKNLS